VIAGLIFHGLNGIRLILHEYGILLGKPKQPVYPYRPALKGRWPRTVIIIMLIIGLLLLTITLYGFLTVWGVIS
jgi:succinate dehydrogenase/fumarate reductase cytochrome b subunit